MEYASFIALVLLLLAVYPLAQAGDRRAKCFSNRHQLDAATVTTAADMQRLYPPWEDSCGC